MKARAVRAAAMAATLIVVAAGASRGQELTLGEALRRAEGGAYANRVAAGQAQQQAGESLKALQGILPSVRVEAGYARTTDPIGTFGMTLRQGVITQNDFDPGRLNHPDARTNYGAALVVEQPLVNVDAHLGRRAGGHATTAARSGAEWVRAGTSVDVVRAYYGAVLVTERVATLEAAQQAAHAHVKQAESMAKQGMVTKSDGLLARVRAGEVEAQLLEVRGEAKLARRRLAVLLGKPADTVFTLPARLPGAAEVVALDVRLWGRASETRSDVSAARAGAAAARTDVQRARSTLLPRINAQARYDWNSANSLFGGKENWSVGVMASWSPFAGAAQIAEVRSAAGRAAAADAQAEAAFALAELEAAAAETAWTVALERLRIAEASVEQSTEAHRIVTRKYEGGLAAVVELLGASTAETEARLRFSHARYQAIVAAAERLQKMGADPAELAAALVTTDSGEQRESE